MLTTAAEAGDTVCLADMVSGGSLSVATRCVGRECSAWRRAAGGEEAAAAEGGGYCGLVGRVARRGRKRAGRTVEAAVLVA